MRKRIHWETNSFGDSIERDGGRFSVLGYSWMGREHPVLDEAHACRARERIKVKDVSTAQEMTSACSFEFLWFVAYTILMLFINKPVFDR